jgi:hypothetical protein
MTSSRADRLDRDIQRRYRPHDRFEMLAWRVLRNTDTHQSFLDKTRFGTHLGSTLEVLDAVSVNVVVRSDRLPKLRADDKTRSIGRWSTREQHDSSTSVGESGLKHQRGLHELQDTLLTSRRAVATPRATPVHLKGLLSCSTGHGSLWSPSRILVNWNSHAWTDSRNLDAAGAGIGCPGRGWAIRLEGLRPSISTICLG